MSGCECGTMPKTQTVTQFNIGDIVSVTQRWQFGRPFEVAVDSTTYYISGSWVRGNIGEIVGIIPAKTAYIIRRDDGRDDGWCYGHFVTSYLSLVVQKESSHLLYELCPNCNQPSVGLCLAHRP